MMIDLKRFCANESDPRAYLREPWAHNGYVYATNGHIVVRIPAPESAGVVAEHKAAATAEGLFAIFPAIEGAELPPFTLGEPCHFCEGSGIAYATDCPDCDGEGLFTHGAHDYDCKECDGEGFVDADKIPENKTVCHACYGRGYKAKRVPVGALGGGFDATYLSWIAALPGALFAARGPEESGRFTFDGGEGLLMPMKER
jgi:hypothetical protein